MPASGLPLTQSMTHWVNATQPGVPASSTVVSPAHVHHCISQFVVMHVLHVGFPVSKPRHIPPSPPLSPLSPPASSPDPLLLPDVLPLPELLPDVEPLPELLPDVLPDVLPDELPLELPEELVEPASSPVLDDVVHAGCAATSANPPITTTTADKATLFICFSQSLNAAARAAAQVKVFR